MRQRLETYVRASLKSIADGLTSVGKVHTRISRRTYGLTWLAWIAIFAATPSGLQRGSLGFALAIAWLILLVPLVVRRMHDVNRSGWWLLLFGQFWAVLLLFLSSSRQENQWGPPAGRVDI